MGGETYLAWSFRSLSSLNAGWKIAIPVPMPITLATAMGRIPRVLLIVEVGGR